MSLSGNAVGFPGSPEGSLAVCSYEFKMRLASTVVYFSSPSVSLLSCHHIQLLRTIVKEERGKEVALFARGLL